MTRREESFADNLNKKSNQKEALVKNRGEIQTPEASKKTQQSSKITQQHLILPIKKKIKAYAIVLSNTRLFQENSRVHATMKEKSMYRKKKREK